MKKLLYICRTNLDGKEELGVVKKIQAQMNALREMQFIVDSLHADERQVHYTTQNGKTTYPAFHVINSGRSLRTAFSYLHRGWKGAIKFEELIHNIDFATYDVIYFRYYFANQRMVSFFRHLKKIHPSIRIILELPAYPYHIEMRNLTGGIVHQTVDGYWRKKFAGIVDLIVTFSDHTHIFGIPAISITNGIDPSTFTVKQPMPQENEIRIIGVGNISPWHGYDRLIKGMAEHRKKTHTPRVKLYVVGLGPGLGDLQSLVSELKMEDDVIFPGQKNKEELERLYKDMHLGIGSLGMFRNNLTISSSLKHREYTAVGLPFVLATPDLDFPEDVFFVKYVPNKETIIDVDDITAFYSNLYTQFGPELHMQINKYAVDHLSWLQRMNSIIGKLTFV
jgi:glycosyltransferase involved in cell wall biosynthesis